MNARFEGKVAIVTGAGCVGPGWGNGRAISVRLAEEGFGEEEIERILQAVPVATHNQRGLGTLHIGVPEGVELNVEASTLLAIGLYRRQMQLAEQRAESERLQQINAASVFTGPSVPAPSADQALPFQRAILLAGAPPAWV